MMMTFTQVTVEMSVTVTDNSPFQDYPHPDDHAIQLNTSSGQTEEPVVTPEELTSIILGSHFSVDTCSEVGSYEVATVLVGGKTNDIFKEMLKVVMAMANKRFQLL